jgi:NDP-sugar pyrophosphorylase family protein
LRSVEAGIFAAGAGARFQAAGIRVPKPLIPVAGRPLIGWVLESYRKAGLRPVTVLVSTRNVGARDYAAAAFADLHPRWIVKDTDSTLESFCVLSSSMRARRMLLSTVDALCRPAEVKRFAAAAARKRCDIVLGVTRHRVDATSLRVRVDRRGRATELVKGGSGPYATAGVYWFGDEVRKEARRALRRGVPSLSNFLGRLPGLGYSVGVVELRKVFDVDLPADVRAAERMLGAGAGG